MAFLNKTFIFRVPALAAAGAAAVLAGAALFLAGCPPTPTPPSKALPPAARAGAVRWRLNAQRCESSFVKLELPVISAHMKLTIGDTLVMVPAAALSGAAASQPAATQRALDEPDASDDDLVAVPDPSWHGTVELFSSRIIRGAAEGPLVDQLTGQPRMATDAGSFLIGIDPQPPAKGVHGGGLTFDIPAPMPLYVRVTVAPAAAPGEYRIPIHIAAPGQPDDDASLALHVSDISLPTDPRVLAVATTDTAALARVYPDSFGTITASYLDRANTDHKTAIAQLDALVHAARAQGVALFVEDLTPTTHVDELGQVTLDWDAYDRVMQPYMDGSAFEDRIPFPVWLAPVPPRRIRDAPTQLWQYIDSCAKHFAAKGWVATPAFMHPALAGGESPDDAGAERLRAQVADTMRLHMPRDMLAVATPDPGGPPHGQLWTINDADPRLPPGGPLANEFSVRAWPWICIARGNTAGGSPTGVKGFVWRHALASAAELTPDAALSPLLVVDNGQIRPAFRMMYLHAGLNDAALLGLLERRTDPTSGPVPEILAGIVGRTATAAPLTLPGVPLAQSGFLYAGWSSDRSTWNQITPTLERLILENDPGKQAVLSTEDPLHVAAQMWLARSRQPVARIAGYSWSMRPGRAGGSDILDAAIHLLAENPIDLPADVNVHFADLPGDFDMPAAPAAAGEQPEPRFRKMQLPAAGAALISLPLAGHVEQLRTLPAMETLELSERTDGSTARLGVQLPIYRTYPTDTPPRADGDASDWPVDPRVRVYGEMAVGTRFLTRPDLLAGAGQADDSAATVRWTYDNDYLYFLARCPQDSISDERNTDWPWRETPHAGSRWWGTDGLQIQLAPVPPTPADGAAPAAPAEPYNRIVRIAFKPAGVLLVQTGAPRREGNATTIAWTDGPPAAAGAPPIKYGITTQRQSGRITGYTVEAAIPRAWVDVAGDTPVAGAKAPAWRVNVLRHRGEDRVSASWAGPVVDDNDVAMMGVLLGE